MTPTWDAYKAWDDLRRERFPAAKHWIYQTKLQEFTVAEFCPLSGRAQVDGM